MPSTAPDLVITTVARLADRAHLAPDTLLDERLIADLGFDSVRLVELVLELEHLGLLIPLERVFEDPNLDVRGLIALSPDAS